jgi:hypothetical protein
VLSNNLYVHERVPNNLPIRDSKPIIGDPGFVRPGGVEPGDYRPINASVMKDKGIVIRKLPGDNNGPGGGLEVKADFFGNPIRGLPDLGAVEIGMLP